MVGVQSGVYDADRHGIAGGSREFARGFVEPTQPVGAHHGDRRLQRGVHHLDGLDGRDEVQSRHCSEHAGTDVRRVRADVAVPVANDDAFGLEVLPPDAFVVFGHQGDHHGQFAV